MADTRAASHKHLDDVAKAAQAFAGDFPDKVAQLEAHLATCHMVVDQLHDANPPAAAES